MTLHIGKESKIKLKTPFYGAADSNTPIPWAESGVVWPAVDKVRIAA
jgi:hypothetical protein